jgi:hypothetical protein
VADQATPELVVPPLEEAVEAVEVLHQVVVAEAEAVTAILREHHQHHPVANTTPLFFVNMGHALL